MREKLMLSARRRVARDKSSPLLRAALRAEGCVLYAAAIYDGVTTFTTSRSKCMYLYKYEKHIYVYSP